LREEKRGLKALAFLLLFVLVFTGVAAYSLQQKGLLTRETLDLYLVDRADEAERPVIAVEPIELAASVKQRKETLQQQEQEISIRSERLAAQQKELDAQRAMLEQRIEEFRDDAKTTTAERAAGHKPLSEPEPEPIPITEEMLQLVKMYENMAPDDAAAVLEKMPDETVAQVLLQMRGRQAAQIMGELDEVKATEVGKLLAARDGIKKLPKPEPVAAP
jgi:flagellar motility protein MotE (MotC chaperone)